MLLDKQELLEQEYLKEKRRFEEKEDKILFQRDNGVRDLEEVASMTHYYLKDYVPDQDIITNTLHRLDRMKEEVYEAAQHDRKQIEREVEDLEDNYYREVRALSNQGSSKKESDD